MTVQDITRLKEAGFSFEEIKEISGIVTETEEKPIPPEPEPEPEPKEDPKPEPKEDLEPEPKEDPEPDYQKLYEELKEKQEQAAAKRDLVQRATIESITDAMTDFYNDYF